MSASCDAELARKLDKLIFIHEPSPSSQRQTASWFDLMISLKHYFCLSTIYGCGPLGFGDSLSPLQPSTEPPEHWLTDLMNSLEPSTYHNRSQVVLIHNGDRTTTVKSSHSPPQNESISACKIIQQLLSRFLTTRPLNFYTPPTHLPSPI